MKTMQTNQADEMEAAMERVLDRRQEATDARRYREIRAFATSLVLKGTASLFGLAVGSAAVYRFILERFV